MVITLTPEIENAIAERARREGISPEPLALDGLHTLFVTPPLTPDDVLSLAAQVYNGLSDEESDEVEQIALDRSRFFEERLAC